MPRIDDGGDVGRREFLRSSAMAAALLAVLGVGRLAQAAQHPARSRPPLRLAVKYGMIKPGATVLEKFELLRTLGYDGVELDSPGGPPAAEVLEAGKRTGIQVPGVVDSVHWSKTLSDADAGVRAEGRAALEQALRDCKACGGGTVLVVPAVVKKGVSYADAYRRSQEEIRKVLPLAGELSVAIAVENVWNNFLLSPLEAARYIDEFESPHIGWHFDVGNIVNYGWPEDWVLILGKRILRLDIKEFSRKKRDEEGLWKGFAAEIGDGDCDWPAVMKALAEVGYSGWACAEVGGGDEHRLADVLGRMRKVLVWSE
jgi:L-ribulose-5-phosphate 3-epimerase